MLTQVAARRKSPVILLLGLLALLLWGQCGLQIIKTNPKPRREFTVRTVRPDSLTAAAPGKAATLYLSLELMNDTRRPQVVRAILGQLQLKNQQWPFDFVVAKKAGGGVVPARGRRQLQIAVPLAQADSLRQLRGALATLGKANTALMLVFQVHYSEKRKAATPERFLSLYRYLQPALPPPK